MVSIIRGTTQKPMASEELVNYFRAREDLEGYLYIGYPIIGTADGPYPIDAMYISREKGLVIFNLIENKDTDGYEDAQDDSYNKMEAKLKSFRSLVKKRKLCVAISVITFAPVLKGELYFDEYPLCNEKNLGDCLDKIEWENPEYFECLVSVLQAVSNIRKGKRKREIRKPDSRGAKLKLIEDSIANLDDRQGRAVIETVEGVQRIRGLAGSGKTIVLALKAAYLHARHPEWKIAVTFNTRALKGQFRQLINNFSIEQMGEEPDWENLQIIHAWGAPGDSEKNGLYYMFCGIHGLEYLDYAGAKEKYGQYGDNVFSHVCEEAVKGMKKPSAVYDAILVDEAQDFSPAFLKMCYEMLEEPKRLVYAYDELQNLSSQTLPAPEEIFGKDEGGRNRVEFSYDDSGNSNQDIILEKCYRNSRPALVTAHALGFGIYRKTEEGKPGLVQMFENKELWGDVGYKIKEGELEEGKRVVLKRDSDSSPEFLETHSPIDDLVLFKKFNSIKEQDEWVAKEIQRNLKEDELRTDDIIVINPDPLTTRRSTASIRKKLYHAQIPSHIAGVDTSPDVFFTNESVAFTGIYRAKGNEAAMVYIINAQDCYTSYDENEIAVLRNRLFTAVTRSKAWVRVLGTGSYMEKLMEEYEEVKNHNFELEFVYPTKAERERLNIINRDMSAAQRNKRKRSQKNLKELIQGLEDGQIYLEDFNEEEIEKLRTLLSKDDADD